MLTSVSSSILAPSACSRASKISREVFPDLLSATKREMKSTHVIILHFMCGISKQALTIHYTSKYSELKPETTDFRLHLIW